MEARICLVDDDESIRDSLEALFRSRRLRVSVFADPARFLSIWMTSELREVPATFVLDMRMPGMSGLELFRSMKTHGLPAHNAVIFLTSHGDVPQAVEVMKNGAFDFVEKPFSDNSLVDRVLDSNRAVNAAHEWASRHIDYETVLSQREMEVAELITQGLTNREIATRIHIAMRTVEVHRSHIFEKLDVKNAVELATAFQQQSLTQAPPSQAACCWRS